MPSFTCSSRSSAVGERCIPYSTRSGRKKSRSKQSQKFCLRTITCIPLQLAGTCSFSDKDIKIPFPRGKLRQNLFKSGLVAKISIKYSWNQAQTKAEVKQLFQPCFENESNFQFLYLTTLPGLKILSLPKTNEQFLWDAKAVLSIHSSALYILCNCPHRNFSETCQPHLIAVSFVKFYFLFDKKECPKQPFM